MSRLRLPVASLIGAFVLAVGLRSARAEPAPAKDDAKKPAKGAAEKSPRPGFEILGSAGYGRSTASVLGVDMEPYGATFGLDLGYVFHPGFRVGASGTYGLGRTLPQRRKSRLGDDVELEVDASSLNVGVSLGYDVPLSFLVVRSALVFGGTFMRWDLSAPSDSIFASGAATSPTAGFFLAPGLTLLWPRRVFEWGVGFDYLVEADAAIPSGFLGKLVMGGKF